MMILSLILYLTAILFYIINHPLMLAFTLMFSSLMYGMMLYVLNNASWLVYILIMVFVSGAMVMFIYMASLSSNEPMNLLHTNLQKFNLIIFSIFPLFFIFTKQLKISYLINNLINQFNLNNSMQLIYKTYSKILSEMTILLTIYLLIVLIVAMKMVNIFKTPLRSKK